MDAGCPRDFPDCSPDFLETYRGPKAGGPRRQFRDFLGISGPKSGKSKWGLSKWGLRALVHNCPRFPTIVVILRQKLPSESGPKRPQKGTIVDDCAQFAESDLKPPFESPHLDFPDKGPERKQGKLDSFGATSLFIFLPWMRGWGFKIVTLRKTLVVGVTKMVPSCAPLRESVQLIILFTLLPSFQQIEDHPHPYRSSKWHYRQRKYILELLMHFIADTDTDRNYF